MSQQLDRPVRSQKEPRPTSDDDQDPIDYRPAPTDLTQIAIEGKDPRNVTAAAPGITLPSAQAGVPQQSATLRGREQTVQLATRISPEVAALIDTAASRTGQSKRQIVEHAIRQAWQ